MRSKRIVTFGVLQLLVPLLMNVFLRVAAHIILFDTFIPLSLPLTLGPKPNQFCSFVEIFSQSSLFSASFASHLNLSYYSFSLSRFHFIIIIIIVNVIVILYTVAELLFSSWISSFVFVILCMCMRIFGFRSSVRLFVLLFVLVFLQMRERESGKGAREGENLGRIYTNTEPVKHFEIISVKWKMH